MSEGSSEARQAALRAALQPGDELLWWAEPTAAPKSVWLPGCMAVPFLLMGLLFFVLGVGSGMGGPDRYTGYQMAWLFGVVGVVFLGVGVIMIRLPGKWKRRYLDAIYGMTAQRVIQVLDASSAAKVKDAPFARVDKVTAEPGRDGTGALTIRVWRRRFTGGRNRDRPEIWLIPGVPQVEDVRASMAQWVAAARQ